jgi:plasmid maintenance system antidote protein VapI
MTGIKMLRDYLFAQNLTPHKFAVQNQIDPSTVSKILAGKQGVGLKLAIQIEDATHGAVPARVWVS